MRLVQIRAGIFCVQGKFNQQEILENGQHQLCSLHLISDRFLSAYFLGPKARFKVRMIWRDV